MSFLYLTEYGGTGTGRGDVAQGPSITTQKLAIGVAVSSNPFNLNTHFIRVHVDAICSVAIGGNPTATTSNKRMAADQTEYWGVRPGDILSVISNT